ncbi:MAG: Maf family nucleotide pyrophosphatase [Endomicrobia bacterium]|nr:Maf family nucleotide pyrophosphatase [Endomicrobiia bacterium]
MTRLVLASSSERRKEILRLLGFNFLVDNHRFDEPKINFHTSPEKFVEKVAINKAKSVADYYKDKIIIAADTIVVLGNEIIGKPIDEFHAQEILRKISNTKHKVLSGLCLFYPKKNCLVSGVEESIVYTNKLSDKKIKEISKKHLDKAGAYAVQEKNDKFVKKIIGDYYNVVGFPVFLFLDLYKKLLIKIKKL